MAGLFPIHYSATGGSSQVDLALEVAADGGLVVEVLTESSLPQPHPVRLGRFAGHLEAAPLEELRAWAATLEPTPVEELDTLAFGTLSRVVSSQRVASSVVDAVPSGLEASLAEAAVQALAQPLAAVEVRATGDRLVIAGIGPEPYPVLLFARDIPGYWMRIWRNAPSLPDGRVFLSADEVQALVDAGQLPEGPLLLKSGDAIGLPLPHTDSRAEAEAGGGFMFWRTGEGFERRLLVGTW